MGETKGCSTSIGSSRFHVMRVRGRKLSHAFYPKSIGMSLPRTVFRQASRNETLRHAQSRLSTRTEDTAGPKRFLAGGSEGGPLASRDFSDLKQFQNPCATSERNNQRRLSASDLAWAIAWRGNETTTASRTTLARQWEGFLGSCSRLCQQRLKDPIP